MQAEGTPGLNRQTQTDTTPATGPRKRRTGAKHREQLKYVRRAGWLLSAPGFLIVLIFGWWPVLLSFVVAFQDYSILRPSPFVGFENFRVVLSDPLFLLSLKNTFYYSFLSIVMTFIPPIIVSILLMEMKPRIIRLMMILWFVPIGSMASIVLWKFFYNPYYGLANAMLEFVRLPPLRWLDDPMLAMPSLILPGLLMFGPSLIYIAALQGIPVSLYETAELSGAGVWKKIWYVTLPRIRPVMAMMLILTVIGNMQVFTQPFVMTGGGPGYATTTALMRIYDTAFRSFYLGRASAHAVLLFIVIMALVTIQRTFFKENLDV